ncbi:DNA polymerase III subunit gamma/tau [Patescibacteria group bacterium]|nr:DNA polymerase III subunit gamma/tau [Patescibacteria group bacterium]
MDTQVLYRKYRPKSFSEVVGQDYIVRILSNALKQNRVAHAYLFSGPRGTGKTSVARILARAANCAKNSSCNQCDICKEFLSGYTLDLVEIDAASNRGIDEIRALRDAAHFLPARARYKVYIIDEVHMLTKEAFNALLKILEEPPGHIIFILATTEPEKVPETISSRTQHLRFRLIDHDTLVKTLTSTAAKEGLELESEGAQILALFSEGSLRDAFNLLGQAGVLQRAGDKQSGRKKIVASELRDFFGAPSQELISQMIDAIAERRAGHALDCISQSTKDGVDPRLFLKILINDFRHLFLDTLKSENLEKNDKKFSAQELENILRILLETATSRFYSPYRELPLELAISKVINQLK